MSAGGSTEHFFEDSDNQIGSEILQSAPSGVIGKVYLHNQPDGKDGLKR
jgi:hypothetical protein